MGTEGSGRVSFQLFGRDSGGHGPIRCLPCVGDWSTSHDRLHLSRRSILFVLRTTREYSLPRCSFQRSFFTEETTLDPLHQVILVYPYDLSPFPYGPVLSNTFPVLRSLSYRPNPRRSVGPFERESVNVFGDEGPRRWRPPEGDTGTEGGTDSGGPMV